MAPEVDSTCNRRLNLTRDGSIFHLEILDLHTFGVPFRRCFRSTMPSMSLGFQVGLVDRLLYFTLSLPSVPLVISTIQDNRH